MKSIKLISKRKANIDEQLLEFPKHVYFHMSFRFDKTKPDDFGLMYSEHENIFIDPRDNSYWVKRYLIDLGWGLEVAFCRLPLPTFDELLQMSLYADYNNKSEAFYCALGILINDYSKEFLDYTEWLLENNHSMQRYLEVYQIVKTHINYDDETLNKKWQVVFKHFSGLT